MDAASPTVLPLLSLPTALRELLPEYRRFTVHFEPISETFLVVGLPHHSDDTRVDLVRLPLTTNGRPPKLQRRELLRPEHHQAHDANWMSDDGVLFVLTRSSWPSSYKQFLLAIDIFSLETLAELPLEDSMSKLQFTYVGVDGCLLLASSPKISPDRRRANLALTAVEYRPRGQELRELMSHGGLLREQHSTAHDIRLGPKREPFLMRVCGTAQRLALPTKLTIIHATFIPGSDTQSIVLKVEYEARMAVSRLPIPEPFLELFRTGIWPASTAVEQTHDVRPMEITWMPWMESERIVIPHAAPARRRPGHRVLWHAITRGPVIDVGFTNGVVQFSPNTNLMPTPGMPHCVAHHRFDGHQGSEARFAWLPALGAALVQHTREPNEEISMRRLHSTLIQIDPFDWTRARHALMPAGFRAYVRALLVLNARAATAAADTRLLNPSVRGRLAAVRYRGHYWTPLPPELMEQVVAAAWECWQHDSLAMREPPPLFFSPSTLSFILMEITILVSGLLSLTWMGRAVSAVILRKELREGMLMLLIAFALALTFAGTKV